MSTKIWVAWRVPASSLNDFLDAVRPQMFEAALGVVERLMKDVKPEAVDKHLAKKRAQHEGFGWKIKEGDYQRGGWIEMSYRNDVAFEYIQRVRDHKGGYNLIDCGLNVWLGGKYAYVIPWGPPSFYSDLDLPEWAEDYHYQNQTDRPDDIPTKVWNERGRTWDSLIAYGQWGKHRLMYSVVNMDRISGGSAYGEIMVELAQRWKANQPAEATA